MWQQDVQQASTQGSVRRFVGLSLSLSLSLSLCVCVYVYVYVWMPLRKPEAVDSKHGPGL